MEGDISEHNAIKLKYHRKKRYKQFFSPISERVNDGHKKIHYNYKCYRVGEGGLCIEAPGRLPIMRHGDK